MRGKFYLARKAAALYFKEFRYFLAAKKSFLSKEKTASAYAIQLRKYGHQLERFLWDPSSYPKGFGDLYYKNIEQILALKRKEISSEVVAWVEKIALEYNNRDAKGHVYCPLLKSGACRTPQAFRTEQLLDLMKQRRSRRIFANIPLTDHDKKTITTAALLAPSSCNRQTIDLIFVEDKKIKSFIASTIPGGFQFFDRAPCIVVFISNAGDYRYPDDRVVPFVDAAAAIENVYLVSETMGLGCCWGSYASFGSVMREKEVRRQLSIPETHLIVGSLAIGKSEQVVCPVAREPETARFWNNRYGKK